MNPWIQFLKEFRKRNPKQTMKQAMKSAAVEWKKKKKTSTSKGKGKKKNDKKKLVKNIVFEQWVASIPQKSYSKNLFLSYVETSKKKNYIVKKKSDIARCYVWFLRTLLCLIFRPFKDFILSDSELFFFEIEKCLIFFLHISVA